MFIPHISGYCLAFLCVTTVHADAYKWIDDNHEVIYSQNPPINRRYEKIEIPPPPTIEPETAEKEIELLIEKQKISDAAQEQQKLRQQQAERMAAIIEENCHIAQYNLHQYQSNPGRRVKDPAGNVSRPSEIERQEKIDLLKQQVKQFCK